MNFQSDKTEQFIAIFDKYKHHIRNAEGCSHVELLRDITDPNTFFTYSHWKDESYLETYKNSAIFGEVWPQTKVLFDGFPIAWSTQKLDL